MLEVAPPPLQLSGLMVTPLVMEMKGKQVGLISVTYHSKFRVFNAKVLDEFNKEEILWKQQAIQNEI